MGNRKNLSLFALFCLALCRPVWGETLNVTVTGENGDPLMDVVVYAVPQRPVPAAGLERFEVEQKNKEFHPFVSVVPVGTTAYFPNRDGIGHHVYSFSDAKTFELPLSEKVITEPVILDHPGVVTVGCNIHDWMVAYIYVVNTPYYGLTGDDGKAGIEGVPAGEYTLHIWHPGIKSDSDMEKPVTLGPGSGMSFTFSIGIRPEYFWKPVRPPENEEEFY